MAATSKTATKRTSAKKPARKPGRPSSYTEKLADEILARIAGGESLRSICEETNKPDLKTVMRWLNADADFASKYARARELQADTLVDRMLDKAESEPERNPITGAVDSASVTHINNQVKTMQWLAEKLQPKKYGAKVDLNHGGQKDNPIQALLGQIGASALPVVANPTDDEQE